MVHIPLELVKIREDNCVELQTCRMKCVPSSGFSVGLVKFPNLPLLQSLLISVIQRKLTSQKQYKFLFDCGDMSASAYINNVFKLVCVEAGVEIDNPGAHGFRRGVASVLERLKIQPQKINLWLGW